jgi:hypothetical protein
MHGSATSAHPRHGSTIVHVDDHAVHLYLHIHITTTHALASSYDTGPAPCHGGIFSTLGISNTGTTHAGMHAFQDTSNKAFCKHSNSLNQRVIQHAVNVDCACAI